MTSIAISRAIGEGIFNYDFSWRTNSDVIGTFIGCMAKIGFRKWAMLRLCLNIFNLTWSHGITEVIAGLDKNLCFPLPEMYMEPPPGSLIIANIPRRPALVIKDREIFKAAWRKMETCFYFLMGWRKIIPMVGDEWLLRYLRAHKAYIDEGVTFDNLERVNLCTPNIEKTSRNKNFFVFPPGFEVENPNDISEVIMICWAK